MDQSLLLSACSIWLHPNIINSMVEAQPFRAPHAAEENILSVVAADTQYRWAVHDAIHYYPIVCWRTSVMSAQEMANSQPCELLSRYLPPEAQQFVFGTKTKKCTRERAVLYRATQRVPAISVYCMVLDEKERDGNNKKSEEYLRYMFGDIPCNFYKLQSSDLCEDGDAEYTIEHLYTMKAVDIQFEARRSLVIDGGSTLNFIATVPKEQTESSKADTAAIEDVKKGAPPSTTHVLNAENAVPSPIVEAGTGVAPDVNDETGVVQAESGATQTETGVAQSETVPAPIVEAGTGVAPNAKAETGVAQAETDVEQTEMVSPALSDDAFLEHIRIVGDYQTLSITSKLRAMHEQTGALPSIDTKHVQKYLNDLLQNTQSLKLFATDTMDAMIGCILQETMLLLRCVVKSWVFSSKLMGTTKGENGDDAIPLICFTGMEAEIINKLLASSSNDVKTCALKWDIGDADDSFTWLPPPPNLPKGSRLLQIRGEGVDEMTVVEVRTERHLVHHGIQYLLTVQSQARENNMSPVEKLRQELIGCRVAKTFNVDSTTAIYRGQIMSVDSSRGDNGTAAESVDGDIFVVEYDDGDQEEYPAGLLYDILLFYIEQGEEGEQKGSTKKAFEIKMSQVKEAVEHLAAASVQVQKKLQRRSGKKSPRRRSSKKRIFEDANSEASPAAYDDDENKVAASPTASKTNGVSDESVAKGAAASAKKVKTVTPAVVSGAEDLDVSDPDSLLGRPVAKYFGEDIYLGEVVTYTPADEDLPAFWRARYSDGDTEDYELSELLELIDLHREYQNGELDE